MRERSIMKNRFAALNPIAVAVLLAGLMTNAPAISIRNARGAILERKSLSGTVSHVDQKRHSFYAYLARQRDASNGTLLAQLSGRVPGDRRYGLQEWFLGKN
jgi:hypothetical protein